jgi:IclR family transcriptional regulator, acetate operon repressor
MSTVQSIERAFSILRALAVGPSGVSEIANHVSLPKSTVARILATLEAIGAVERMEDSSDYRIGSGIGELAGSLDASATLAVAVKPHLARLAKSLGEAAGFSVPVGYAVQYLVQAEGPNPVQVRDYSGLVVPMHVGPAGLCMMAFWPREEITRYLSRPLETYTALTVVDRKVILERLAFIRKHRSFWVHEEFSEGISSVAAPVFDRSGRVLGAIHVHGPSYRFPPPGKESSIAEALVAAAEQFSERTTRM